MGVASALIASSASMVPAGAVTASAGLVGFTADSSGSTGAFSVPISAIPGAAFSPQGGSSSTGVQSVSLGRISLGRISLGRISLGRISLGRISLGRISLNGVSLGRIANVRTTLQGILLPDIPIKYPSGCTAAACTNWSGVLAGTGLEFAPLQNVSLLQVLDDPTAKSRFESLTLADIDVTRSALGSLPAAAVALSDAPLSRLPLPSRYAGATTMAQWCTVLSGAGVSCADDLGIDPANPQPTDNDVTLVTLSLGGVDLDSLPLDDIILTGLDPSVLGSSPLGLNAIGQTDLQSSSLGRISLGRIDLAKTSLGRISLGRISLAGTSLGRISLGRIDLSKTSLGRISLGRIDLANTSLGRISLGRINLSNSAIGDVSLGRIDLSKTSLGRISLGRIDLSKTSLGRISLGRINLAATSLGRISLGRIAISQSSLGRISLGRINLAGTSLGRISLGRISLLSSVVQCADLPNSIEGFDCSDLTGRTLADVPSQYLQGTLATLFNNVSSGADGLDSFNGQEVGQLIAVLTDPADPAFAITLGSLLGDLVSQSSDPAFTIQLAELIGAVAPNDAARAVALSELLGALVANDPAFTTQLSELVGALAANDTVLSIQLGELLGLLSSSSDSAFSVELSDLIGALGPADPGRDVTLAELVGALPDPQDPALDTTVLQLFSALVLTDPAFGEDLAHFLGALGNSTTVTLEDLILGLLGLGDLPWEQLDLGATALQDKASPTSTPVRYSASIAVDGDGAQDVSFRAQVPDDFLYRAGSTLIDGNPGPEPSRTGSLLTWSLPGLGVGTHTLTFFLYAGLSEGAAVVTGSAGLQGQAPGPTIDAVTNVVDTATSAGSASPAGLNPDTLYLGHITPQRPSNFFALDAPGGKRYSIRLGNLGSDYDLILYDLSAANPLRHAPTRNVIPVEDPTLSLQPLGDTLQTDALQDLALVPGHRVYGVSIKRGSADEEIDTGTLPPGQYLLQVVGYNGASSPLPYSLRTRAYDDVATSCRRDDTAFANRFAFPADAAPSFAPPAATSPVDTLVLANPDRLAHTWGAAAVGDLLTQLGNFMTGYGGAKLVRLDDPGNAHGVLDAYDAWDRDPCSVDAANNVVRAIGLILDDQLASNPGVRNIVVLGPDDQIPMARVRDAARVANERGRAVDFAGQANALVSSLSGGFVLSDDAYATANPVGVGDRDLFVPDLHVGRLLESPAEIGGALSYFTSQAGTLPASATTLTTGYDFLKDGAQAIDTSLRANGRTGSSLINETWTRADLAKKLLGADTPGGASNPANPVPDITSLNAHFDEQNALPAIGNSDKSQSALFTLEDLEAAGTRGTDANGAAIPTLRGRLLFSMGCHSGLNLSDKIGLVGSTKDWAQEFAEQQAIWIANTGFGYGDSDTVAFSERLMSLLADQLDRSATIGEALTTAKQRYAAGQAVWSPYDEKALSESTFYGLPMWKLPGAKTGPAPSATPGASAALAGTNLRVAGYGQQIADGGTAGGAGKFHLVQPAGTTSLLAGHYEVDGQTQQAPRRPIEPRVEVNISPDPARDPTLAGYVAKGAMITGLQSKDIAGFKPDYFRPTVDDSRNETDQDVGDAAFPAGIQAVNTFGGGDVPNQRLVVVPGQFRPTPGLAQPGRGNERLVTGFNSQVFYARAADPDNVSPTVVSSSAEVSGSTLTITARVTDSGTGSQGIKRVSALYTQSGVWTLVDLDDHGGGVYAKTVTGLAVANAPVDSYLQALDFSGNVGSTSTKGAFFNAQNLASQGPLTFTFASAIPKGSNGWWRGPVTVTVKAPTLTKNLPITYTITDTTGARPSVTPATNGIATFTLNADSIYTIVASQSNQQASSVQVLIDHLAPDPGIGFPAGVNPNGKGWLATNPLAVSMVPIDPNDFGSGVTAVNYSATGANPIAPKTTDEPPVNAAPVSETFTNDGKTDVTVSGTDRAGNVGVSGVFPVWMDSVKPTASIAAVPPVNAAGWHKDIPTVTITGADAAPGNGPGQESSGVESITYQVNNDPVETVADVSATFDVSEGRNTIRYTAIDAAGNESQTYIASVKVDLTAPNSQVTLTPDENNAGWVNTNTTVGFSATDPAGPDGAAGSGLAKVTYSATADPTKGGANIPSTDTAGSSASKLLTTEGITTFTFGSTDTAGNAELANQRIVRLDKTKPVTSCPASDGLWHAANQTFTCTATDPLSGLANPSGDASFTLSTSVAADQETATASTDSRQVPDVAGNVAVAGPIVNNKIDRKKPTITLTLPTTNPSAPVGPSAVPVYLLGQTAKVTYSCADGGSGVQGCSGLDDASARSSNAQLSTSSVGLHTFTVNAVDKVGNTSTKALSYRVVYNLCLQYDPTKSSTIGASVVLKTQLCDSAKANVSSSSITLPAVVVNNDSNLLSPNGPGGSNPSFSFSYDSKNKVYQYTLKTDSRFLKTPLKNWLSFRVSTDPQTPTGSATDVAYLDKLYRVYFLLK